MPQLRHGARRTLDYLYADLNDIIELAKADPDTVRDLARKCIDRVRNDIEPMLQRAAPGLEKKIADIEARLERIECERFIVHREARHGT